MPNSANQATWFHFRRDLADELGFGEYHAQRLAAAGIHRKASADGPFANRRPEFLSPQLPQFIAYFTKNGLPCVTADFRHVYHTPRNALFDDFLGAFRVVLERNLYFCSLVESAGGVAIDAGDSGIPPYALFQDSWTGAVYYWSVDEKTLAIMGAQ